MASARVLLHSCKPLRHVSPPLSASSSSVLALKCQAKTSGFGEEKISSGSSDLADRKKSTGLAAKASVVATPSFITVDPRADDEGILDLASFLPIVRNALVKVFTPAAIQPKSWKSQLQLFIEKIIVDCRFFTLLAVTGSLLGSVLCFVEGCFLTVESYFHYFNISSHSTEQGHMIHLLIEAIDMYLVGTALFIFGVGLYAIFVGSENLKENASRLPASNLFGNFYLRSLPTWVQMDSVSQAKSKIGHAVLMILQVGLLEKFKSIPLLTSLDLACFAGTVLISSAATFLLSKLSVADIVEGDRR